MTKLEVYEFAKHKINTMSIGEAFRVTYGNSEFDFKRATENVFHVTQKLISNGHTLLDDSYYRDSALSPLVKVMFD